MLDISATSFRWHQQKKVETRTQLHAVYQAGRMAELVVDLNFQPVLL
jgi:hypothetical protein